MRAGAAWLRGGVAQLFSRKVCVTTKHEKQHFSAVFHYRCDPEHRILSAMKQRFSRFAVWSNVFYLAPLVAALYFGLGIVSVALLFLIIFSTAFHAFNEEEFVLSDIDAAWAVVIINTGLLAFGPYKPLYIGIVFALTIPAMYTRYFIEQRDRGCMAHGFWHLLSAAVTLVCILSYALPF